MISLLALLIALFAYAVPNTSQRVTELEKDIVQAKLTNTCLDIRFRTLTMLYEYVQTEHYAETRLRNRYGYSKPGEYVIQIFSSHGVVGGDTNGTQDWWWISYFSFNPLKIEIESSIVK